MVHTQFDSKIKTIRIDNGTEFYLKDFFTQMAFGINYHVLILLNRVQLLTESINTSLMLQKP